MFRRSWGLVAVVVAGMLAITVFAVDSAEPAEPRPSKPRELAPAKPAPDDEQDLTEPDGEVAKVSQQALATYHKLEVRYAEVFLLATKLDLQKINEINQRMSNLYSDAEVQRIQLAVQTAEERLKAAKQMVEGHEANFMIGSASAMLRTAEQVMARANDVNRRLPGTVSPTDLERHKVAIELAKVSLEKAKALGSSPPPLIALEWQMDELREEVRQMRWRLTAITSRR